MSSEDISEGSVIEGAYKFPNVINLSVGGKKFATRLSTLRKYPDSMIAVMFSGRHEVDKDQDNNYFIDRDGTYFHYILNFLRNEEDLPPFSEAEEVLREAMYYGIEDLVDILKSSPPMFAEMVVRENIRRKLLVYNFVKDELIRLARDQAVNDGAIVSTVRLVTTKNQPIPRDLQFSKQVYKQYFKKFKTYKSFEHCFGQYSVNLPSSDVDGYPDDVMDSVASCLQHDLVREGYSVNQRSEGTHVEQNKIKTVTWCDEEFHVCMSCHIFKFDWLGSRGHKSV